MADDVISVDSGFDNLSIASNSTRLSIDQDDLGKRDKSSRFSIYGADGH